MPKNKMIDLRNHLFESIENVKDATRENIDFECKKGNTIKNIAQTIINSAKLELEYIRTMDNVGLDSELLTDFMDKENKKLSNHGAGKK